MVVVVGCWLCLYSSWFCWLADGFGDCCGGLIVIMVVLVAMAELVVLFMRLLVVVVMMMVVLLIVKYLITGGPGNEIFLSFSL